MDNILLKQIQKGEYLEILVPAENAKHIAEGYSIKFLEKIANSSHRNVNKNIWNRNLIEDFSDFDTIKHCIFYCLVKYRTIDNINDTAFVKYQELLKIPFNSKFEDDNISKIRETLIKWNMNARGSKLADLKNFSGSLQNVKNIIENLNQYQLLDFLSESKQNEIMNLLLKAYNKLQLTPNNPFVTNSKTFHFLMPQLFIPMDRTYTVNYFTDYKGVDLPNNEKELVKWALSMHTSLANLYKANVHNFNELSLQTRTPITKLLDDMLIGYAMYRRHYCQQFNLKKYINTIGEAENRIE